MFFLNVIVALVISLKENTYVCTCIYSLMPESAIIKEIYEYLSFKNIVKLLFYIKQYLLKTFYLKCAIKRALKRFEEIQVSFLGMIIM